MRVFTRRALPVAVVLTVAACGSGSRNAETPKSGTHLIRVTLTDAGCPASLGLVAGPTTFAISNDGARHVTELEIEDRKTVLGKVDDIRPGHSGVFSLTLKPGSYRTYCGGARLRRGTLTVAANARTLLRAAERRAVARYRSYLERQTRLLVHRTTAFAAALQSGKLHLAQRWYSVAREPYERIEPVVETFDRLDSAIDALAGDVPAKSWRGFHAIERILWMRGTTRGARPLALELLRDVKTLRMRLNAVKLEPSEIADDSAELLNDVSRSKLTGQEERYSHTDLVDFQANLDGSRDAFDSVRPLLASSDPRLAQQIAARFAAVNTALAKYRRGNGFVSYTELTSADTRVLSQSVDALAEPLSRVGAIVASK